MMNNKNAVVMKMFFFQNSTDFNLKRACSVLALEEKMMIILITKILLIMILMTQMMIFGKSRPAQSKAWQEALVSAGGSLRAPNWV